MFDDEPIRAPDCGTAQKHLCLNDLMSSEPSWWAHDAQGIPLCRVCDRCEDAKLSRFRPEILSGYDQRDVDEPIEPEYPGDF